MSSVVLHLWLVAASATAAPGGGPVLPQSPAVVAPAAPSPSAPPVPAPPGFPAGAPTRASGASPSSGRAPDPEAVGGARAATGETRPSAEKREANPDTSATPASPASGKSARPAASGKRRVQPVLPTLTPTALKNELRQSLAAPGEAGVPVSDRARLEQLASEIAHAREALRQETARLEALIKQRGSCEGEAASSSSESDPAAAAAATAAKEAAREQLDSVSKALKGMKPEQAAAVLSLLERRLAAQVLRRMRPADAGAVMGYLKPEQAADLATEIATRKQSLAKKGATP